MFILNAARLRTELCTPILRRQDVECLVATDPSLALEAARRFEPDLVILSGPAPVAAGLVRELRLDPVTASAPVAVVNQDADVAADAEIRAAGANVVVSDGVVSFLWERWIEELLTVPRRRSARVPVRFQVWCHSSPVVEPIEAEMLNISVHGMLLESSEPVEMGGTLDLTFNLPGEDGVVLRAVGLVVRHDGVQAGGTRFGVKFTQVREETRERIRRFVETGAAPS